MTNDGIKFFVNCGRCCDEVPDGESFESYGRLTVGFTKDGRVRVWCVRHDMHVVTLGPDSFFDLERRAEGVDCAGCGDPIHTPAKRATKRRGGRHA